MRAADLYEEHFGEFFAVLTREAGKALPDCIAELREAVDFIRYYAGQANADAPRGIFTCISPWNFPLAIFSGQITAALAAGNGVLAKPAENSSLVACVAVRLLHEAGVPREVLQLLPGKGSALGPVLTGDSRVSGVCFTGSTATAQRINRTMADGLDPRAPLIAETGGLNAMIVDSTALPEQAVRDVIADYVAAARKDGRLLHEIPAPKDGAFLAPALIKGTGIADLEREVFGPVLHLATFKAHQVDDVLAAVNARGYGLTFGLHSRIDDRVQHVSDALKVGNIYINRNQIGAIVGSQPFGGEGLSGTGPKAGGPNYVPRFRAVDHDLEPMKDGGAAGKYRHSGAAQGHDPAGADGGIEPPLDPCARHGALPRPKRGCRRRPGAHRRMVGLQGGGGGTGGRDRRHAAARRPARSAGGRGRGLRWARGTGARHPSGAGGP